MRLKNCEFLPDGEFGITGTPALDPRTATIYITDALGFAHALDLGTLEEREGWPIRLYPDPWVRLTWGAVTLVQGRLYVGTGELCRQNTSTGKLFSVDLHTRAVSSWTATPERLGGGGGIWGWGGVAYDRRTDSILAATSDAYEVGKNRGKRHDPAAGFAAHLVQFDRRVRVRAAHSPFEPSARGDLDFSGTPIVLRASGCPALVAAENKNGTIYVWRLNRIEAGLHDEIRIAGNLNGQPAWSPRARSLYVGAHDHLHRLALTKKCRLRTVWSIPLGVESVNGPPTVAGDVVWLPVTDSLAIWAVDARSGEVLWKGSMGEPVYTAPTVIDGRVYAGGFAGLVRAFG
jgi:outer membrane protein assembly factor BamB